MSKEYVSLGAMLVGLVLLGCSFWWSSSDDPPSSWTDEEAQAYLDTGVELHDMTFKVRRNGPPPKPGDRSAVTKEEVAAKQKLFDEKQAKLDSARNGRKRSSWVMFGAGVVLTMGGLFVHKLNSE